MPSIIFRNGATEVLEILNHTQKQWVDKIPNSFINFLQDNSNKTYIPNFDYSKPIKELDLSPKAQAILGIIYLKYWANEKEKKLFNKKVIEKDKIYQEKMRKEYISNNVFNQNIRKEPNTEKACTQMQEIKKENFISKIINNIKKIFRR